MLLGVASIRMQLSLSPLLRSYTYLLYVATCSIVYLFHVPAGNDNDHICVFACAGEQSHADVSLNAQAYACVD